jgi:hypothetical protein
MILLTLTTCLALGFVDTDAPKEDPEFNKAISRGAKTKIELHVVDDEGVPVPAANVKVTLGMVTTANIINGQTDTNGVFIIEGKTRGNEIIIQPKKDGYYNSKKTIIYWGNVNIKVKNGKWQPYGEKMTVVLRKIKKTSDKIIKFGDGDFKLTSALNQWIGFDLKENDYVEPHGKGKIADFEVLLEWDGKWGRGNYTGMSLSVRFLEPYSGFYVCDKELTSNFIGQYNVIPGDIKFITSNFYSRKIDDYNWDKKKFDKNTSWVIRSRCIVDDEGKLVSSNYSILYSFDFCCRHDSTAGICVSGYFNPIPNDTNLEHKVRRWDYNVLEGMDKYY